jgi:hypothetical protein
MEKSNTIPALNAVTLFPSEASKLSLLFVGFNGL